MAATQEMITVPDSKLTSTVIASLVLRGDISALSDQQKIAYYQQLCDRVGLDPATSPFVPMKLNGKEILYAGKGAAEQLRKLHRVAIKITSRERVEDVYCVTASAQTPDGRTDESIGAVPVGKLAGDNLANAIMKAETKAKRRVTLSIVGLGMMDESEIESIQGSQFAVIPKEEEPPHVEPAKEQAKPKEKAKKWTPADPIPDAIMRGLPPPVRELAAIPLANMVEDDLDLVVETCKAVYPKWKARPETNPKLLELLQAITAEAAGFLAASRGQAEPPPNDVPPLDYDPTTGEVHS